MSETNDVFPYYTLASITSTTPLNVPYVPVHLQDTPEDLALMDLLHSVSRTRFEVYEERLRNVMRALRVVAPRLQITLIACYGSVSRGDYHWGSDIDLLIEHDRPTGLNATEIETVLYEDFGVELEDDIEVQLYVTKSGWLHGNIPGVFHQLVKRDAFVLWESSDGN